MAGKRLSEAGTYTITLGQQPIGMARADNPQDAIELIKRLSEDELDDAELRLRRPTAIEADLFAQRCGPVKKEGVVGFCF